MRILLFLVLLLACHVNAHEDELLHASFDVTQELFKDINEAFISKYHAKIKIHQSHGGSGKQTAAIIHGLPADIVSLALAYQMDVLSERGLVAKNWRDLFPQNSSPFSTRIVFLVRAGNPKNIKDWGDLIKEDVKVIAANPKTSGGALWNYLTAWAYASKYYKDPLIFMSKLYHNVPVLDSSARGAAITFLRRNIGDVLITWESEAKSIIQKLKPDYLIVRPSISVKIDTPIAAILQQKPPALAQEYLRFLFSSKAQEIITKHHYHSYNASYPEDKNMLNIEDYIDWKKLKEEHFGEDGIFEKIYQ